jgi:hypothetical protein
MPAVVLQGGPAAGVTVDVRDRNTPLNVEGHGVPTGQVARYKPLDGRKRDNTVFRFVGMSKVIARIPQPRKISPHLRRGGEPLSHQAKRGVRPRPKGTR